ncbi:MAG: double-strand break repair protein AddB [Pseudomonadota bacterium]
MSAGASGPARAYTIQAGLPFLDTLAKGMWTRVGEDPLALARARVLLPTRRAARALADAFLRLRDGEPLLLPRLTPVGDVDDDELALAADAEAAAGLDLPPAISELRRRLMLARLIRKLDPEGFGRSPGHAAGLAGELARLLDQVETERLSLDGLAALVPGEYAEHWQRTLRFLDILTRHWPGILGEEGAIDAAERRNRALAALARQWRQAPPAGPVYAAGTTGSIPATSDLLDVVARLPGGAVILPGLDRDLDAPAWAALEETHPQYALKRLLERLGIERDAVENWTADVPPRHVGLRVRLLGEALRPAATTEAWRRIGTVDAGALEGLHRIDCAHPQQEAGVIALLMREALETPHRTAALVTPDRALARRVAAELKRFGVAVDDSAGVPLADTPPGAFLRLVAEMVAGEARPAALLACLKHPLAAGGLRPAEFRARARRLEVAVLRGPPPGPGFEGVVGALQAMDGEDRTLIGWLAGLAALARPFAARIRASASPAVLLRAHVALAEALAGSDEDDGPMRLWAGEAGAAAAAFIAELAAAAADFPAIEGAAYPAFFDACLAGRVVRPAYGGHPRLRILGLLEARLLSADLLILGGLNEGVWPPEPAADPWLSRPMRKAFGLPGPERRIGLAAHDFAQACGGGAVILTRAARVEGAPTVPSRWLLRLDTLLAAAGLAGPRDAVAATALDRQRRLDRVAPSPEIGPPAPTPPVKARPRRLSVTDIETWRRDPYALYARHVLRLKPLPPLEEDPGRAERGIFIHAALDDFLKATPDELPEDALARLIEFGRARFGAALARPGVWAFWWPRFEAIAGWFISNERARRRSARPAASEVRGRLRFEAPAGAFTLTAKADRIDRLADGSLAIIDYKTGMLPAIKHVVLGYAPQLGLEAAIARAGGFDGLAGAAVTQLRYWRLAGGEPAGAEVALDGKKVGGDRTPLDPMELAAQELAGLEALVARFDDPATPYHARPRPGWGLRYNDYAHLARIKEWSALEDER